MISFRARINNNIPGKKQRHSASDENKTPEMTENGVWPKNTVLITGDSMLTNINERTLSKNFNTKVRSFPGARVSDMFDYLKPLLRKNPGKIILVIGANDVERNSAQTIMSEIRALTKFIHESIPHCHVVISEIFKRTDKRNLNGTINEYNKMLKTMKCDTLRQQNITLDHLGKRGFHLNFSGSKRLAKNIIEKIRTFPL